MDNLIDFFKILSDETRLRLLVLLYHRDLCVCQFTGITGLAQPNVSKHLARLRDLGLVKDQRREQYIFYSLDLGEEQFEEILRSITDHIADYPVLKLDLEKSRAADKFLQLFNARNGK